MLFITKKIGRNIQNLYSKPMKKLTILIITLFFFNSSINAALKEIGQSEVPTDIQTQISNQYEKNIKKNKNIGKKYILYFYTDGGSNNSVWESGFADEITDKFHEKLFKKCTKQIRKYKISKTAECSLYAVDKKVVWNFSTGTGDTKLSNKIALYSKPFIKPEDKKSGRFFEDQPDTNDDYQIHFNYLLAADTKDFELDINGKMEGILLDLNKIMASETAKHPLSNGESKKFKFDYRKDGKLDITFIRLTKKSKEITKHPNNNIIPYFWLQGLNNPKKIYFNFADIKGRAGNGEAGPGLGSAFIAGKTSEKNKLLKLTIHELYHTQGQGFECVPGVKNGHYINKNKPTHLGWGLNAGPAYMHEEKGCPQTADSVYLTPTSIDSYDPYKVMCLKKYGNFNHPKILKTIKMMNKKIAEGAPPHEIPSIGAGCKWTQGSRDNSGFLTKSGAVSDYERLK